jgi:hypothetical protein
LIPNLLFNKNKGVPLHDGTPFLFGGHDKGLLRKKCYIQALSFGLDLLFPIE